MVKIEISNRAMYFLVTFGIIALFAVGVFAYNSEGPPSVMGHSVEELEGVCRSNGVNCLIPNPQPNLGLYLDGNRLCYPTSGYAGCNIQTETCSTSTVLEVDTFGDDDWVGEGSECAWACGNTVACYGDSTSFGCGDHSKVYYDQWEELGFDDNTDIRSCLCSVSSGKTYKNEVPSNSKCLDDVPTVVSAVCNNGEKSRSDNDQIIEVWCGTTLPNSGAGCVAFLQYWDHNDDNPDDAYEVGCKISSGQLYIRTNTESGDPESTGAGSVCGAVCGATVLNL